MTVLAQSPDFLGFTSSLNGSEPDGVEHILHAIRTHLDMDVAFVSRVTADAVTIQHVDARGLAPFKTDDWFHPEEGYCQRIIDGRIPYLISDTSRVPEVAELDCTKSIPIGSHVSIPIHLDDGMLYGTFCCFSHTPNQSLNERDLQMMKAFAQLAARQIEAKVHEQTRTADVSQRIRRTIEQCALSTVYQPIYRLQDNRMVGVECLARFSDSEYRSPHEWFADAHEVGLGVALEIAAFRNALRGLSYLPESLYLAVNVSPEAILSGEVERVLSDIPADRVVLEITEHAIVSDYADLHDALSLLRDKVRIAVDDVGAGYSGLVHILEVKPEIMKLDISLTRGIDSDPVRAALATALVTFANEIGSTLVAEGIETSDERQTLERLNVGHGQGFFLCRPMPVLALSRFLMRETFDHKGDS